MRVYILVLCSLLFASCAKKREQHQVAVPVSAMKVVKQTIPKDFEFVAVAESSHIIQLRARVEGYLEKILYKEGEIVKAGEPMFVLDQRPFQAALAEAEGTLDQKRAKLWDAVQIKNRMIPLYKENAISQRDLDNALAQELAAEANVKAAEAQVEKAAINLGFATISAPVDGWSSRAVFREGALISPGPDSLLTNIYVIDPIWVNFSVSEGDLLKGHKQRQEGTLKFPENNNFEIEVVLPTGEIFPAEGKIDFLDPALQQSTGTMLVRTIMKNPGGLLRPGMFVNAVVKGAYHPNAVIVPQSAVQMGQGGTFVFVVKDGSTAMVQPVVVGEWYKDFWIVEKGLKEGDVVIGIGVNKVRNGGRVVVNNWLPSSPPEDKEQRRGKKQIPGKA